jgi:hypothetical protein
MSKGLSYYPHTGWRIGFHEYLHPRPLSQNGLLVCGVETDLSLRDAVFHSQSDSVISGNDFVGLDPSISHFVPLKNGNSSYNDSKNSNSFVRPLRFFPLSAEVWKWGSEQEFVVAQ